MKSPLVVPVESLNAEPYTSVVCYPKPSEAEAKNRILELAGLDVEALEFSGQASAFTVHVLGKGYVGVVVVAYVGGQRYALKMRRIDADRESLAHEAELLKKANSVGVGPKFIAVSRDFLLMQLVDGDLLGNWLKNHREIEVIRRVLEDVLEQCWRLDEAGLDHGELSKAPKHLLVDASGKPFIVDFEAASVERRVANVTAICQFLFQGNSDAAKIIVETFGARDWSKIVEALKRYKKNRKRANFEELMRVCLWLGGYFV